MKCDNCSSTENYTKNHKHIYTIKGRKIEFYSERRFCKKCNNLVFDECLDNVAEQQAIEEYNKKYGIQKERIIALRKKYNLSQELLSKIIGCARKTLISYEKGLAIPNDNYVIIINSLIDNPDTMKALIKSSRDKFTAEEYREIKNKVKMFNNNMKQLYDAESFIPTEYNGYTPINKNKIINMILFFSDSNILKTKLLKEMFYADFMYYKKMGASITGLEYAKINLGPVPDGYESIINECSENNIIDYKIEFKGDYEYHTISKKISFDVEAFDEDELKVIEQVKKYFKEFSSKKIVDFSHEEKAFTESEYNKLISYNYAFDIDRKIK